MNAATLVQGVLVLLIAVLIVRWLLSTAYEAALPKPPFDYQHHKRATLQYLAGFNAGDSNLFVSSHDGCRYPLSFMEREVRDNSPAGRQFVRDIARHLDERAQFRGVTVRGF